MNNKSNQSPRSYKETNKKTLSLSPLSLIITVIKNIYKIRTVNVKERIYQRKKALRIYYILKLRSSKPIIIHWIKTSHTERSCIASYLRQFSTNIKIEIIKLKPASHFNTRGKLCIIRNDIKPLQVICLFFIRREGTLDCKLHQYPKFL